MATPILERLWGERVPRIVAIVQREVADRLAAAPGNKKYGRLSILAAVYGTVELFQIVPSRAFHPPPQVEGRIVVFTARPGSLPVERVERLAQTTRVLFSARRKQLGNLLPRLIAGPGRADDAAGAAEWPADWARRRPEELPPEAFFRLANYLEEIVVVPKARPAGTVPASR